MFLTETWLTSDIPETEIFLGNNFKVVNRNERESGDHGGLLTASSLSLFHKIVNFSIKRYYFSGGCVIIDDHCLNCFIAIYNPQTPKFQVALPTLSNCLHEYYKIFTSFREKRGTNIPYVIYVVGDFNLPKINCVNLSSSQPTDMEFLDLVADLGLNQFITVPTHIKGNTLDLLFSTCDELCYSVYNIRLSDHFPVLFQVEQSNIWEPSTCSISKSTFRPDIFSQHLDPLYILFTSYSTQNPDFISSWYGLIKNAVSLSIATKRSRRINAPFYFSSHTLHLINQQKNVTSSLQLCPCKQAKVFVPGDKWFNWSW